jgi:hypothetical protein
MLAEVANCSLGNPEGWPSSWTVQELDSIRYFNVAGPDWAALDARLNPWGVVDDGLWEFTMDKCASSALLSGGELEKLTHVCL